VVAPARAGRASRRAGPAPTSSPPSSSSRGNMRTMPERGTTDPIALPPAFLEVVDSDGDHREVRIDCSPFLIGRGAESGNHLQLSDKRISRSSAAVVYSDGLFSLEDRGQRLGVLANGQRITSHPIRDGDVITFGATEMVKLVFRTKPADKSIPQILSRLEEASALEGGSRDLRQLSLLLEATSLLQSRMPLEEVLAAMVDRAITVTDADRGLLLEADARGQLHPLFARQRGAVPLPVESVEPSQTAIARTLERRTSVVEADVTLAEEAIRRAVSVVGQQLRAVMAIPLISQAAMLSSHAIPQGGTGELLGVLYLDSRRPTAFSALERRILEALAVEAASILDNTRLVRKDRERQRLEREVAIAQEIQQALLPKTFDPLPHLQVTGVNKSCHEVGGDYFDLIELGNRRTAFMIADVAGKGLGAALVTALLQGTFSALTLGQEPARVMTYFNHFSCARSELGRPVTLFLGILDADGKLEYANAGHPPPLLIRGRRVESAFHAESLPLGMFEEAEFRTFFSTLEPGDTLVLFTDGITDALSPEPERFQIERLEQVVTEHAAASPEELQAAILKAVEDFTGGVQQTDDMTLLILRYLGAQPA